MAIWANGQLDILALTVDQKFGLTSLCLSIIFITCITLYFNTCAEILKWNSKHFDHYFVINTTHSQVLGILSIFFGIWLFKLFRKSTYIQSIELNKFQWIVVFYSPDPSTMVKYRTICITIITVCMLNIQALFWSLWIWLLTSDLTFCRVITFVITINSWKCHDDTMKRTLKKRRNKQADRLTDVVIRIYMKIYSLHGSHQLCAKTLVLWVIHADLCVGAPAVSESMTSDHAWPFLQWSYWITKWKYFTTDGWKGVFLQLIDCT